MSTMPSSQADVRAEWPEAYPHFEPRRWVVNGHLQTIVGNFLPRPDALPEPEVQLVEVSPAHGSQISRCSASVTGSRLRSDGRR
jgi:hypothetical protein